MTTRLVQKSGFTLIELLVIVSVIGLLASVVLVSLNDARAKGRNSRRAEDANQLRNAFALSYSETGVFPTSTDSGVSGVACVSVTCYGAWSTIAHSSTTDTALSAYLKYAYDPQDSNRGFGGYVYMGYLDPTAFQPTWSPGAYIGVAFERVTSTCLIGQLWSQNSKYTYCLVYLGS